MEGDAQQGRCDYTLYTSRTPNGYKVSIMLEELKLNYKVHALALSSLEQKQDWFIKLNPNGRIPVIVDHTNSDFVVFETGAILLYLAEKHGNALLRDGDDRYKVLQWVFFQHGGMGPMQGQCHVFRRYAPEKIPYAIERYQKETQRLYEVIEKQLVISKGPYVMGDTYSIADIAIYPWMLWYDWADVKLDNLPNVKIFMDTMSKRPAVIKGINVPPETEEDPTPSVVQKMLA